MNESKEFANNAFKKYFEIAKGESEVDEKSFPSAYELLPDLDAFEENKNRIGKELLASLRYIEPSFLFYRRDESSFLEDPKNFSMRVIPGSEIEKALMVFKNVQAEINELYGHYSVALYLLNYIVNRNISTIKKNNKLVTMYEDILAELNEKQKNTELANLIARPIEIHKKDVDLLLTNEEKKMPVPVSQVIPSAPPLPGNKGQIKPKKSKATVEESDIEQKEELE